MKDLLRFTSDDQIHSVVEKFEQCQFSLEEFHHGRHLTVGMSYLWQGGFERAMERLRRNLIQFSGHHGRMGYNETITRFWLLLLQNEMSQSGKDSPMWQVVNHAIEKLGCKELLFEYYSRECAMSDEAKSGWLPPDLKAMDGIEVSVQRL